MERLKYVGLPNKYNNSIKSIDFSKDEKILATGASNGQVSLWDVSKIQQWADSNSKESPPAITSMSHQCADVRHLEKDKPSQENDKCSVNNVRFLKKINLLATTGDDGTLRLWRLNGQPFLPPINVHKGSIKSLNPNGDDRILAIAGDHGFVELWNINGKRLAMLKGHRCNINNTNKCSVNSVWFHPNQKQVATAGDDGTVRLWNLNGEQQEEFQAHREGVEAVRISKDGLIATSGSDGKVRLWKDFKGTLEAEFLGHHGSVVSTRFNEEGDTLATAGKDDGTVRIWAVPGKPSPGKSPDIFTALPAIRQHSLSRCPSPSIAFNLRMDVPHSCRKCCKNPLTKLEGHQKIVESVRFSPKGDLLVTASDDETVRLWNLDGKQITQVDAHQKGVNSVRFSPNKTKDLIVTGGNDGTIKLWRYTTKSLEPFKTFERSSKAIRSINFNNQGDRLVSGGDDGIVKLWDLKGTNLHEVSVGNQDKVTATRFSPDGKLIAIVGENGTALLWNPNRKTDSTNPEKLLGHQGYVNSVGFSPNEKKLATAGDDGIVRLWDYSGKQLKEFKTYEGRVTQITFSRDGKLLSTSSANYTSRLWNLLGQEVAEFTGHQGSVTSADFSPDGKFMATASEDNTAIVWPIRGLDELLHEGCDRLKDYLITNPDEKKKLSVCP